MGVPRVIGDVQRQITRPDASSGSKVMSDTCSMNLKYEIPLAWTPCRDEQCCYQAQGCITSTTFTSVVKANV